MTTINLLNKDATKLAALDIDDLDAFAAGEIRRRLTVSGGANVAGRIAEFDDVEIGHRWQITAAGSKVYSGILFTRAGTLATAIQRDRVAEFACAFESNTQSAAAWRAIIGTGATEPGGAWAVYAAPGDAMPLGTDRLHLIRGMLSVLSEF